MTYLVAIANEKGGVAKTTTALSLGAALGERGQRVLLVDLDPQANLTLALGVKADGASGSIADLLQGRGDPAKIRRKTHVQGVDLLPANSELLDAERFLGVRQHYEQLLGNQLAKLEGLDYILFDCPPALAVTTRSAMAAADLLVVPTQAEFFSANALKDVLELIRETRQHENPELRYRILLTMLDRRNRIHRTLFERIRQTFGAAVFETVIEVDTRLRESPIFAQPITSYAPSSRGAVQYRALAEELVAYATEVARRPA